MVLLKYSGLNVVPVGYNAGMNHRTRHRARRVNRAFVRWVERGPYETMVEIARILGVATGTVRNWKYGQYKPRRDLASRIEVMSEGRVPVTSWDD